MVLSKPCVLEKVKEKKVAVKMPKKRESSVKTSTTTTFFQESFFILSSFFIDYIYLSFIKARKISTLWCIQLYTIQLQK